MKKRLRDINKTDIEGDEVLHVLLIVRVKY